MDDSRVTLRLQQAVVAICEQQRDYCERAVRTGVTYPPDPSIKGKPWRQLLSPHGRELIEAAEEAGVWRETPEIFT